MKKLFAYIFFFLKTKYYGLEKDEGKVKELIEKICNEKN